MKPAFFLQITTVAAAAVFAVGLPAARACQYCRQAYEDPDAGRMITDNRGGSFSLDSSLSQYQAAPPPPAPPAELKTAPAPGSVATSASDLAVPGTHNPGGVLAVRRPTVPPPPVVAAPKTSASVAKTPVPPADPKIKNSVAHWSDACLLGMAAAGGIFCWRTRRKPSAAS